jgi:glycosidase
MEFHVSRVARDKLGIEGSLFRSTGNVILPDFRSARLLARRINERVDAAILPERAVRAGRLNAMALIDEILHDVARLFREKAEPGALRRALATLERSLGRGPLDALLLAFVDRFPPLEVYEGRKGAAAWLEGAGAAEGGPAVPNRELALEELLMLRLANENPAFAPFRFLFDEAVLAVPGSPEAEAYGETVALLGASFAAMPKFGPDDQDLLTMLRSPAAAAPYSLPGQLDYIRSRWGLLLGDRLLRLLGSLDLIREEEKPRFPGPGPTRAYVYSGMEREYERFSPDKDWMPNVVMMAKSVLVWLYQLSRSYGREVRTLDSIPDEELDALAGRGFNALWLIGLWERSSASAEIKRRCGNPEAAASAYSLFDYEIAGELGGWPALERLRERCGWRGIRLAADMVPNHTGIDSTWVRERPGLFVQSDTCPFPGYTFNGGDLSGDGRVGLWLEDHYYDRSDAAVVFKRLDRATGAVSYLYHGNDGTGLPWCDTAQIDFLKKESREAVMERILHVARNFPIIRFDAAMIMAKKHFRRLWYPEPGQGGDIASRAEKALAREDFDREMPEEFWREVVDMCARETPDTLLLAEAFWMMEGYFVRTLGMHRVYNSAFMNMIKKEENAKYRETIRNTQEFDKDILKRFVNFMNNPDEETAVAQFGKGDKYFGACTMMATMPGLPMFGHGQLEGFEEKYGMEYRRAYRDEVPDGDLLARHEREIFPLLKRRRLFSGVERFLLYDLAGSDGSVNENVFAYSNGDDSGRALVAYNNSYSRAEGRLRDSNQYAEKLPGGGKRMARSDLAAALGLADGGRAAGGRERFCVMREQRSELWFIRRSRELADSGLHLMLNGFQCQVFLDFFEVEDDERGLYASVHDALGGAGTGDFSATVQDVALKELYATLADLVTPELLAWAGSLSPRSRDAGSGRAKAARGIGAPAGPVSSAALAFYAKVRSLMREAAAEEGLPGDASLRAARQPEARRSALGKRDAAAAKAAAKRFGSSLAVLAALPRRKPASTPGKAEPGGGASPDAGLSLLLMSELALPGAPELALCYAVFDGLKALCAAGSTVGADESEGARRIVDRYYLDRKLREALRARGMHGDEAYKSIALAKALLPKLGNGAAACPDPATTLYEYSRDDELRTLLGFNVYGGVTWFNKERFEEAARRGALYDTLGRDDLEAARCARTLIRAASEAGYSLEALAASMAPALPKPKAKSAPKAKAALKPKAAAKPAKAKAAPKPKSVPKPKSAAKLKGADEMKTTAKSRTPSAAKKKERK